IERAVVRETRRSKRTVQMPLTRSRAPLSHSRPTDRDHRTEVRSSARADSDLEVLLSPEFRTQRSVPALHTATYERLSAVGPDLVAGGLARRIALRRKRCHGRRRPD